MDQHKVKIFAHPDFINKAKVFYEKYDIKNIVSTGNLKFSKRKLKGYTTRNVKLCP